MPLQPAFQVGGDLPAGTTTFSDIVPVTGLSYTYRVKAFKTASCGWTTTSNTVIVPVAVSAPAGLTAAPVNTTRIDLTWNYSSASETGFIIERCLGASCGGTDFQPLATKRAVELTHTRDVPVRPVKTRHYP